MLILRLKKGEKVAIGIRVLKVITIHDTCVYVDYKGQPIRIDNGIPLRDNGTTIKFHHRQGSSVHLAFDSTDSIWRLQKRDKAV